MEKIVFKPEVRCLLKGLLNVNEFKPKTKPDSVFFCLDVPSNKNAEKAQLVGSRVNLIAVFENEEQIILEQKIPIGTVVEALHADNLLYDIDYGVLMDIETLIKSKPVGERGEPIVSVFVRLDSKDIFEQLKQFSFESGNPNAKGWATRFHAFYSEGEGEYQVYIPVRNILGYFMPKYMLGKTITGWGLVESGWPHMDACAEFFVRRSKETCTYLNCTVHSDPVFAPDRTTRSKDLLTVTTVVKRKSSPWSVAQIAEQSAKYGKPLKQIEIVKGSSVKYGLIDQVQF